MPPPFSAAVVHAPLWRVLKLVMSANRAALGPLASNLRLTRPSGDSRLEARFSPKGRLAHA